MNGNAESYNKVQITGYTQKQEVWIKLWQKTSKIARTVLEKSFGHMKWKLTFTTMMDREEYWERKKQIQANTAKLIRQHVTVHVDNDKAYCKSNGKKWDIIQCPRKSINPSTIEQIFTY